MADTEINRYVNELHYCHELVSLDTQHISLDSVSQRFMEILTPIGVNLAALTKSIERLTLDTAFFTPGGKDDKAEVAFVTIMNETITIPTGLKVKMRDYLGILEPASVHSDQMVKDCMLPFKRYLADLITNKASLEDASKYALVQSRLSVPREKFLSSIGRCFHDSSNNATARFGKVFDNLKDYQLCVDKCNKLNEWLRKVDLQDMLKHMREINELCEELIESLDKNKLPSVSKANLKYLSSTAFEIGKELQYFATTVYRIQVVSATMSQAYKLVHGKPA